MFKKTLISLAVASSLGLTGCFSGSNSGGNDNPKPQYADTDALADRTFPFFAPGASRLPIPNDLIFRSDDEDTSFSEADGTFEVDNTSPPVTAALNQLSGASTVAPIVIQTNGLLDESEDNVKIGKNVHLIELAYASGDPVQGLGNGEPPTLAIGLPDGAGMPKVRAEVVTLDGTSAIRILPLEPLKPGKRYVVVVTNDVKDINGDPIIQDPSYSNLTAEGTAENPGAGLPSQDLLPVRTLINSLWEPLALKYAEAIGQPLSEDQIALSYSFTTSKDTDVLRYIAEPGTWFSDQVRNFIAVSAAVKTQKSSQGSADYSTIKKAVDTAVAKFPASLGLEPAETPQELAEILGGACGTVQGQNAIDCLGIALATKFKEGLPTPTAADRAGTIALDPVPRGAAQVSLLAASVLEDPRSVYAIEGTITLPNYLGNSPADLVGATEQGEMLGNWEADDQLASQISGLLQKVGAPALPHANPDQTETTAVNYIFPFPKQNADQPNIEAPILVLYPSDPSNVKGIVSFQHGITTDRSTALTFGTALAEQGYVVAAIDHPLHGVSPFSIEQQGELAGLLIGAAVLDALGADAITDLPEEQQPIAKGAILTLAPEALAALQQDEDNQVSYFVTKAKEYEDASGISGVITGTTAEEQQTFAGTVTSLLNSVENAGSQIPGLAPRYEETTPEEKVLVERHFGLFPGSDGKADSMVFDPSKPVGAEENGRFFINLSNFLKTRDNLRQSVLDQMNLRASLASLELPFPDGQGGVKKVDVSSGQDVYFAGHSLGGITGVSLIDALNTDALEFPGVGKVTFVNSSNPAQSTFSAENNIQASSLLTPGGGIVRLLENSDSFAPIVLGGLFDKARLEQGDSSLEAFLNVAQATVDSADPINFIGQSTTDTLISVVIGDTVIPNAADAELWADSLSADAYDPSPLSGTLTDVPYPVDSFPAPLAGTVPLIELGSDAVMSMSYAPEVFDGVEHGTPVDPTSSQDAFGGMVCSTLITFGSNSLPSYCPQQE
ncbi:hypothetical protein Q667_01600 [Marinobacter sp. C1S70]|uniref:hypothetical protein n=1 Tax=Marinobacter sp. C1S70 TaxID=1396859 RepID=UPI0003B92563|nr:hypothetical protein [Marinobacter sp. C1S70]ERS89454.1 hypothetical protein Q667_01600 [Marinobacter sp. C1S70]